VVCCGLFERDHGKIYSAHAVAFPDGRLESQRKAILTRAERTVLRPQRRRRLFVWDGVRFALLVCADNALPDCAAHLRRLDLGLLLHPCAGRFTGNKLPTRKDDRIILRRARDLARELGVAYAVANPVGFSGEDWYAGNSWIMNRRGRLLAHAPSAPSKQRTRDRLAVAPIGKENE
jgi:predicted amidohydrolase